MTAERFVFSGKKAQSINKGLLPIALIKFYKLFNFENQILLSDSNDVMVDFWGIWNVMIVFL